MPEAVEEVEKGEDGAFDRLIVRRERKIRRPYLIIERIALISV